MAALPCERMRRNGDESEAMAARRNSSKTAVYLLRVGDANVGVVGICRRHKMPSCIADVSIGLLTP